MKKRSRKRQKKPVKSKKDSRELLIIFFIAVVSLFALSLLLFPGLFDVVQGPGQINATAVTVTITRQQEKLSPTECLGKLGISEDTVFFFSSNRCTFSQEMKPSVIELQNKGYKFFFANIENVSAVNTLTTCLSSIANLSFTPEFICPATGESFVGSFSGIDELKAFADRCKK